MFGSLTFYDLQIRVRMYVCDWSEPWVLKSFKLGASIRLFFRRDQHFCPYFQLQSGGWWFRDCSQSNLNGLNGEIIDPELGQAMHWGELGRDPNAPIIKAEMKIRPSSSKMKRRQYHRYFSFEDNSNLLIS